MSELWANIYTSIPRNQNIQGPYFKYDQFYFLVFSPAFTSLMREIFPQGSSIFAGEGNWKYPQHGWPIRRMCVTEIFRIIPL